MSQISVYLGILFVQRRFFVIVFFYLNSGALKYTFHFLQKRKLYTKVMELKNDNTK